MGISYLLPFLEKSIRPCHVSEFRGSTVAVDSYCWLHKGAIACAAELARGEHNTKYLHYCLKYVKMLLQYDIKPIMVFDGQRLPAKKETEMKRREGRAKARKLAAEMLILDRTDEAHRYMKQCIDITPDMALYLIKECRKLNVDCIVAPYESDAQLAFFDLKHVVQCIISEDSDLMVFGCKKVLYKMDLNGGGFLVESEKIHHSMKMSPDQYSFEKFRYMCILSGCDYVNSLPGIGLRKALKFIKMTAENNPQFFLNKLPSYLNMRHLVIDDEYKEKFLLADATFRHQLVFDPFKRKLTHLTELDEYKDKPQYLRNAGAFFDNDIAFQLALGNLDPSTLEKLDNWKPQAQNNFTIWSSDYQQRPRKKVHFEITKTLTKTKSLDPSELEEQIKRELKFKKELMDLYTKPIVKKESLVENRPEDIKLSPSLSTRQIPFIKKERMSKFGATNQSGLKVVKSMFFSRTSDDYFNCLWNDDGIESKEATSSQQFDLAIDLMEDSVKDKLVLDKVNSKRKEKVIFSPKLKKQKQVTIPDLFKRMAK